MSLPRFLFPKGFATDFTIHNLPYGVYRTGGSECRIGVAIGDKIIDMKRLAEKKLVHPTLSSSTLNPFMSEKKSVWSETRHIIKHLLSDDSTSSLSRNPSLLAEVVVDQSDVEMVMPVSIGDYTDFYASEYHASNVGKIFRPNQEPLLPNWKHLPVGYHGRASSVVVSGTDIVRPCGQLKRPSGTVDFGPSEKLDFEVELGFFFGGIGNQLGSPIPIENASEHIFGVTLMNDWSARDIQFWEYVPLGPFLSKNFGTSISPWIVTMDALEEFKVALPQQVPEPLLYLRGSSYADDFLLDINIETRMNGEKISKTNSKYLYWSISQMIAHHSVSGCNLRPGDLLGSGTISAPEESGFGSLLELTWNGSKPIHVNKDSRTFVRDNDVITMTGFCEKNGIRIGFGSCAGRVVPAKL
jgi:fumarylacetoacetase